MSKPKSGKVYLVGAGPGDPGLLTLRAAELLGHAEVIVHDRLVHPALLAHAPAGAQILDAASLAPDRSGRQDAINRLLVDQARAGRRVVRLKGGDPYVFGRGGEEAEALAHAGIPFEVVPGVSSFSAVPAYAGIPLTHRQHASAFTVVTGHEDPTRPESSVDWAQIARLHGTKVVLMGLERLPDITARLLAAGQSPETPVSLVSNGTLATQKTLDGRLADIADIADRARQDGFRSPAIAVIGEVVRLRGPLGWFEARPLFGRRVVVTRAREQAGEFSRRLADLGAEVLEIPTVRIAHPTEREPMIEALAGLGEYDWVVFTSVNGVNAFFDGLLAAFEDLRAVGNLRFAAVGSATAARIRELHLRVDAIPDEFVGKAVADAIEKKESLENLRVLLARAEVASPELCRQLEDRGAIVDDVSFYRTMPETNAAQAAVASLLDQGADWLTFTSSSTVTHLHARIPLPPLLARHPHLRVASIGPETSKTLANLGIKPAVEANPHNLDGLIKGLLERDAGNAKSPRTAASGHPPKPS